MELAAGSQVYAGWVNLPASARPGMNRGWFNGVKRDESWSDQFDTDEPSA